MKVAFPKNARISIRFGARQWERLRQVAVERGETLAELVRSALSVTVLKDIDSAPLPPPRPPRAGTAARADWVGAGRDTSA